MAFQNETALGSCKPCAVLLIKELDGSMMSFDSTCVQPQEGLQLHDLLKLLCVLCRLYCIFHNWVFGKGILLLYYHIY